MGGEPTLHPDFDRMLAHMLEKDFMVQVFTNGMVSRSMLDKITAVLNRITLRPGQLSFGMNINEERYRTEEEDRQQKRFLDEMGKLAYLAFTIHENTDLQFLYDTTQKYYLDNTVRLGLAMPISGVENSNKFLPMEAYRSVAESIIKFSDNSPGVNIIFDCGFPLCMFHIEELSELVKNEENQFSFMCGAPLDIYPDLSVTNCYPLSRLYKNHIVNFSSIMDLYKFFEEGFESPKGIYGDRCTTCQFFKKSCMGGCKGFAKLRKR
jgi:radical SAM protein with 4Fe4S-binding SPASM domain